LIVSPKHTKGTAASTLPCPFTFHKEDTMSTELNKIQFKRIIEEVWNEGKIELIDELFDPEFLNHTAYGGTQQGVDGIRQLSVALNAAFDDLRATFTQIVAEDDMVTGLMMMHGKHVGTFMGIEPTYREVTAPMCSVIRFRDGKAIERWGLSDDAGMFMQLGGKMVVPGKGE
jgi:predicted ester cyclase